MADQIFQAQYPQGNFNKWAIPVRMGIITGVIITIINLADFMVVLPKNYIAFLVFAAIAFLVAVILYGVTGAQQRKAMGGYINFKNAFAAISIAILIAVTINSLFSIIYVKFIDPHFTDKMKESTLAFMEKMKVPQEKLDQTAADMDKQLADSNKAIPILLAYLKSLLFYGVIGLICAAIVQRKQKVEMR